MTKKFLLLTLIIGASLYSLVPAFGQLPAPATRQVAAHVSALVNGGASFKEVSLFTVNPKRLNEIESSVKNVTPVTLDFNLLSAMRASASDCFGV
jgi:hypothetical protein